MSVPALRQPKILNNSVSKNTKSVNTIPIESSFMIVTLRDTSKLVISSDSYHGILVAGEVFKCVLCKTDILDAPSKERHKNTASHLNNMELYPHIENYGANLVRKPYTDQYYCTICNVLVSQIHINRHIISEVHLQESKKAGARSNVYKEA